MSRDEVEAVLAHEISHVANGDMVTLALIQGVVNTFVVFLSRVIAFVIDRVVFKVERGHGPAFWIVSLLSQIVLGIFASMIVMWFSRWREFRADAGGASLAGRGKMISALRRLQESHKAEMPDELVAFASIPARWGRCSPVTRRWLNAFARWKAPTETGFGYAVTGGSAPGRLTPFVTPARINSHASSAVST